jgi:predicted DNA-binding protein
MRNKKATSFRLKPETLDLLEQLKELLGISQASVVEMLIRDRARKEGLTQRKGKQ